MEEPTVTCSMDSDYELFTESVFKLPTPWTALIHGATVQKND